MVIKRPFLALLLALLPLSGCVQGLIYQDTTTPLTTRMRSTPISIDQTLKASAKTIKEPITPVSVSATWSGYGWGAAVKGNTETPICSADYRLVSYVLGIWRRDQIIAYPCPGPKDVAKAPKKVG